MRPTAVGHYAFRLTFGQASHGLTQSQSHNVIKTSSDRLMTRSATMLALFGIALSTFSLKQMLNNPNNRGPVMQLRKLY